MNGLHTREQLLEAVERLVAENTALRARLRANGIEPDPPTLERIPSAGAQGPSGSEPRDAQSGNAAKLELFAHRFRARSDVYAQRWDNPKTGRSGYSPACANEWRPGVCGKPQVKCSECPNASFKPLDRAALREHLRGNAVIGVYPLLAGDLTFFVAIDLDDESWREDARALAVSCSDLDIPFALECSRSGNGAHLWVFFEHACPASTILAGRRQLSWPVDARFILACLLGLSPGRGMPRPGGASPVVRLKPSLTQGS